jgi:hypothetical protein
MFSMIRYARLQISAIKCVMGIVKLPAQWACLCSMLREASRQEIMDKKARHDVCPTQKDPALVVQRIWFLVRALKFRPGRGRVW